MIRRGVSIFDEIKSISSQSRLLKKPKPLSAKAAKWKALIEEEILARGAIANTLFDSPPIVKKTIDEQKLLSKMAPIAERIVQVALRHGGKPFGGYIRDYKIRGRPFKDLDIWFRTEEGASAFIASVKNGELELSMECEYNEFKTERTSQEIDYGFKRMRMNIVLEPDIYFVPVDLVVAENFPVSDCDCNLIIMDEEKGRLVLGNSALTPLCIQALIDKVRSNKASVLPGYLPDPPRLPSWELTEQQKYRYSRIETLTETRNLQFV